MLTIPIVVEVQEFHLCKNEKRNINLHHSHYISQGQKQEKEKEKRFYHVNDTYIPMIIDYDFSEFFIFV